MPYHGTHETSHLGVQAIVKFDGDAERELALSLCEGPFEHPLWSKFLSNLRSVTQADYAGISFRPPHQPLGMPVELYDGREPPEGLVEFYRGEGYKRDPLMHLNFEAGAVYRSDDLFDRANPEHLDFIENVLTPRGMNHLLVMQIHESGGIKGTLCVARDQDEFTTGDRQTVERLAPFFEHSLRTHLAIDQARFNVSVSSDALGRLNFGWLGLSADGLILGTSAHAENVLQESKIISRTLDGKLTTTSRTINRELAEALQEFAKNRHSPARALNVSRDPWFDLLLGPVSDRSVTAANRPICIAYVHDDRRPSSDRYRQLAELFGLTKSEARLALSLSRGRSIAESAADLGLSIETARNYSKRIYQKTGARGQSHLIIFILSNVLALA